MDSLPDLSPFTALARLGEGGVGEVFKATDLAGDTIAVKVLHEEVQRESEWVAAHLSVAREMVAIHHDHIVHVRDAGHLADGQPFVSMDYVEARTLADTLIETPELPWQRVVEIALQVCRALQVVHDLGVVHRDLTPANILLVDSTVKVTDFGGQAPRPGNLVSPSVLGTPEYWSPEQAMAMELDHRSDLYSLGIVMYEALSGTLPFSSHSYSDIVQQHAHQRPAPLRVSLPDDLEALVMRCLEKDPSARFGSAKELEAALARLRESDAPPAVIPKPTTRPTRRIPIGRILIIGVSAFVAVWAIRVFFGSPQDDYVPPSTPDVIALTLTSEPSGAVVYRTGGGAALGKTPTRVEVDRSQEPIQLMFRFPEGQRKTVEVIPSRAVVVHATKE